MGPDATTSSRQLKHVRTKPNVKTACEECRSCKTKCDGARPTCLRCAKRGRRCDYDADPDEYRSTALRRKCREFERAASDSKRLLQIMCETSNEEAISILQRLRRNERVDFILSVVDDQRHTQDSDFATSAESANVSASAATSSGSATEPSEPLPMLPSFINRNLVTQDAQQTQQPFRAELVARERRSNPLAIDFLVNNDEGSQSSYQHPPPAAHGVEETDIVTGTNNSASHIDSSPIDVDSFNQGRTSFASRPRNPLDSYPRNRDRSGLGT